MFCLSSAISHRISIPDSSMWCDAFISSTVCDPSAAQPSLKQASADCTDISVDAIMQRSAGLCELIHLQKKPPRPKAANSAATIVQQFWSNIRMRHKCSKSALSSAQRAASLPALSGAQRAASQVLVRTSRVLGVVHGWLFWELASMAAPPAEVVSTRTTCRSAAAASTLRLLPAPAMLQAVCRSPLPCTITNTLRRSSSSFSSLRLTWLTLESQAGGIKFLPSTVRYYETRMTMSVQTYIILVACLTLDAQLPVLKLALHMKCHASQQRNAIGSIANAVFKQWNVAPFWRQPTDT